MNVPALRPVQQTDEKPAAIAFSILSFCWLAAAAVVTYPAPKEEALSSDYKISAGGKPVDVYIARVLDPPFAGKEYKWKEPSRSQPYRKATCRHQPNSEKQ